jgi:NAD(P)H-quinone oxidoreductase subunit 5
MENVYLYVIAGLVGSVGLGLGLGLTGLRWGTLTRFATGPLLGAMLFGVILLALPERRVGLAMEGLGRLWSVEWTVDRLGLSMFLLSTTLGIFIARYSFVNLANEPTRPRFMSILTLTIGFVQLFTLCENLWGHLVIWLGISVSVHLLLRHYDHRPRAALAAKKKFIFSRLGDVLFASGIILISQGAGTTNLSELAAAELGATQGLSPALHGGLIAIVVAAALKSAQFPGHAWLPETLDAPTPVSALLHAGVVNAGGLLLLRLSPLLAESSVALTLLVVLGATTAAFGVLVGLVQNSVKMSLAWSTVAQMGFVFLEIGLGLFTAAWCHLLGHAAYKAYAFLRSGTLASRRLSRPPSLGPSAAALGLGLIVAAGVSELLYVARDLPLSRSLPLGALFAIALSPVLARAFGRMPLRNLAGYGGSLALLLAMAGLMEVLLGHAHRLPSTIEVSALWVFVSALAVLLLSVLSLAQGIVGALSERAREAFHVHALNGFYMGELTDAWVNALWPSRSRRSSSNSTGWVSERTNG